MYTNRMRSDREKATQLRKNGKSYSEIASALGISKSTLAGWFKNQEWSSAIKKDNSETANKENREKMVSMNAARNVKWNTLYTEAVVQAKDSYIRHKGDPLFWAGLMLYAGEGDKRSKHLVRISNAEFYVHRIFIAFCLKYLYIPKESIRCALITYPDQTITDCILSWSKELSIPLEHFYKTQVIQGKETRRKLHYGVGMSIIPSTVHKKTLMTWLELAEREEW